ncbi:hypothetical protein Slin15195_G100980 [Septoria linicola]|uniref:Myb-like domain-containing protein n=1 Tax=Septoria linicola TaxID=215465 RepID=A0A9Q9AWL6_9PEZI|nr:hypothetical protein Slin15195_G100980 [Septoria linicola]
MSGINLTAREQELLCAVIEVMKADIKWPEVARIANFTTPKQARDKWPSVRNKLVANNKVSGEEDVATPTTKSKKTSKRKAASEEDAESTPVKSAKKPKVKPEPKDGAGSDDSDLI